MSSGYYRLGANVPNRAKEKTDRHAQHYQAGVESFKTGVKPPAIPEPDPRAMGYTGDICTNCQGSRVRFNGTCKLCEDCGTTTGCS